jgi:hypothetical protein
VAFDPVAVRERSREPGGDLGHGAKLRFTRVAGEGHEFGRLPVGSQ